MSLLRPNFNGYTPPRERSCGTKQCYRNLFSALTAAHFIYKRHRDSMWPYKCFYCVGYHLGHPPKHVRVLIKGFCEE